MCRIHFNNINYIIYDHHPFSHKLLINLLIYLVTTCNSDFISLQVKMKLLGIEFAPLAIPLERRLQTLAVFYYGTSFIYLGMSMVSLCIYLLFTRFYFLALLYFAWFIYDRNKCNEGGRRWEYMRRWRLWKYFADYFPVKMIKTAEFDPNKNYILGYHPHGIMCYGAFSCFGTEGTNFSEVYPGITPRILTLEGQFWFPLHREHVMSAGKLGTSVLF